MKKIIWNQTWRLSSGQVIPAKFTYLKDHVTPTSLILGFSGYFKDLSVKVNDISKIITSRPTVTDGYYLLTRIQYNRSDKPWQPRFYLHLTLVKPLAPNNTGGKPT